MCWKTMITLLVEENNPITPNFYNKVLNPLQFHCLACPCGQSGCLSVQGYYHRYIKAASGKLLFRICCVKCACCGHTHALLLSSLVPYSQISLADQVNIIYNHETALSQNSLMNNNPSIDESNYRYLIRQYLLHWKQKLLSEQVSLHLASLTASCFSHFMCQFMQIKHVPNILFLNTT